MSTRAINGGQPVRAAPFPHWLVEVIVPPITWIATASAPLYLSLALRYRPDRTGGLPRERFVEAVQAEGIPVGGAGPVVYKHPLFRPTAATSAVVAGLVGRGLDLAAVSCPNAERISVQTGLGLSQQVLLGTHRDVDDVVAALARVAEHAPELAAAPAP
jgi:dTDP-4-amino-4,6-dideoxygalactose transaminase